MKQEREPVGTCFLQDGAKTVEYAPCRSSTCRELCQLLKDGWGAWFVQNYVCVCVCARVGMTVCQSKDAQGSICHINVGTS